MMATQLILMGVFPIVLLYRKYIHTSIYISFFTPSSSPLLFRCLFIYSLFIGLIPVLVCWLFLVVGVGMGKWICSKSAMMEIREMRMLVYTIVEMPRMYYPSIYVYASILVDINQSYVHPTHLYIKSQL